MRNSRISTRLMNTCCSWNKNVFAPLVLAFEPGDEIIVAEVLQELLTHSELHVLGGLHTLFLQRLNIGRNEYTPKFAGHGDSRLVDPPLCNQPVAFQPSLHLRNRRAV